MRIEISHNTVDFEEVGIGEVFVSPSHPGKVYMAVESIFNEIETYNAVELNSGRMVCFEECEGVEYCPNACIKMTVS